MEDTETNKTLTISKFLPKILPVNKTTEGENSLNSKQKEVLGVVHTWLKGYVKNDKHNFKPGCIFLSGSGGTGKFYLVKIIYNVMSKTLLYHCNDPKK